MSAWDATARAAQAGAADAQPEPLQITVGDAAALRLQPMPGPRAGEFGYLHAERGEPVACSWIELVDACRSGQALMAWTPQTAEMVPPREVPQLPTAILEMDLAEARSGRLLTLLVLILAGALALNVPFGWLFAAGAALIAWSANLRVLRAEERTEADIVWRTGPEEASAPVRGPAPYTLAIAAALAAAAVAQTAVLGSEWLDGWWDPADADGGWLRVMGEPMLHADSLSVLFTCVVLAGLGSTLEREAPRAYLPLSFVVGVLVTIGADLLLPGTLIPGPVGGLMGMAGFFAVLAERQGEGGRSALAWLTSPVTVVSGSALVLAFSFAYTPLSGAGLLAGIALGMLSIPRRGELVDDEGGGAIHWMGLGALGLVWLSALAAILSLVIG